MALNFPSNPTVGQVFTAEGATFVWNGALWLVSPTGLAFASNAEALAGIETALLMSPANTRSVLEERARRAQGFGQAGNGGDLPTTFAPLYTTTSFVSTSTVINIIGTAELNAASSGGGAQEVAYRWTLKDLTQGIDVGVWERSAGYVAAAASNLGSAYVIPFAMLVGDRPVGNTFQVAVDGRRVSPSAALAVARRSSVTYAYCL